MPTALTAIDYNVKILFDTAKLNTDPFLFQVDNGPIQQDFSLEIDTNIAVIHFYLLTLTENLEHLGSLATGPIQWLSATGSASPMPATFFLRRQGESQMTLIDLNDVETSGKVTFNFEIAVVYRGRTYTSPDPTIVNVQPPPVPSSTIAVTPSRNDEAMVS